MPATTKLDGLATPHWSFAEMRSAFGVTADEFVFYGGYPGATTASAQHRAVSALSARTFDETQSDRVWWGRLVESAIGAYLANTAVAGVCRLFYWRERNREVDFVIQHRRSLVAIGVKSGAKRDAMSGARAFAATFKPTRTLLVGADGISVEDVLTTPVEHWFDT